MPACRNGSLRGLRRAWRGLIVVICLLIVAGLMQALRLQPGRGGTLLAQASIADIRSPVTVDTAALVTGPRPPPPGSAQRLTNPPPLEPDDFRTRRGPGAGARPPKAAPGTTTRLGQLNAPGLAPPPFAYPPDTTGAIGPLHYVEMVNNTIGVFDRAKLSPVSLRDTSDFFGVPFGLACDVQVLWDDQTQRWFVVALDCDRVDPEEALFFGWSKTADPTDLLHGWCVYRVKTDGFADYPKLGDSDTHLVIGSNDFGSFTLPVSDFLTANIRVVRKPAVGTTACASTVPVETFASPLFPLANADGSQTVTPVPANSSDASPRAFVVAAHRPQFDQVIGEPLPADKVMTWGVEVDAATGASILRAYGDVGVRGFFFPEDAPQPGTNLRLDTLDARITQAVSRAEPAEGGLPAVWFQHTVGLSAPTGSTPSVVRWYEVTFAPGAVALTPSLRQQGDLGVSDRWAFNGAISPASNGTDAAVFFNTAGPAALPDLVAASRQASTPLGTLEGLLVLGESSAPMLTCEGPPTNRCRWGDYAGATPDPVFDRAIFGSNQVSTGMRFSGADPGWRTRNAAVTSTPAPYLIHDRVSIGDSGRDGTLDPGETFTVVESIRNSGAAEASGVRAVLITDTPLVQVTQAAARYPHLPAGRRAAGSPKFAAALSPDAACGSDARMLVAVASDQGRFLIPLTVQVGAPGSTSDHERVESPPKTNNDITGQPIVSTLEVGTRGPIHDVNVRLNLTHPAVLGDLIVRLTAPDGTEVMLANREGFAGGAYDGTVLDDEAETPLSHGASPFNGTFRPDSPLGRLHGREQYGTWTLTVLDVFRDLFEGVLNSWSLEIQTATCR